MKRKIAWLALPLVLFTLVWGVKWRVEHPTPTKEDFELRALMRIPSKIDPTTVEYHPSKPESFKNDPIVLSKEEIKQFVDSFYISPKSSKLNQLNNGSVGTITVIFQFDKSKNSKVIGLYVSIGIEDKKGLVMFAHPDGKGGIKYDYPDSSAARNLHPVTVKHWLELLRNHPQIGAERSARLK